MCVNIQSTLQIVFQLKGHHQLMFFRYFTQFIPTQNKPKKKKTAGFKTRVFVFVIRMVQLLLHQTGAEMPLGGVTPAGCVRI